MKKNLLPLVLLLITALLAALIISISADSTDPLDALQGIQQNSSVFITEICAKNDTIIPDNDGKYRDYVELYNSGEPVDLTGYTFYDGKVKSPPLEGVVLETGEYRVFFISRVQSGFALGASGGDTLQLLNKEGRIVAQTNTAPLDTDEVMLYQDGTYKESFEASPGFANDAEGRRAFLEGVPAEYPSLVISEVLIDNISTLPDEKGIYSDIVELQNISDAPLDLSRWFLSDDMQNRFQFRFPSMSLEPGEYLLICCDSENYVSESGLIHTNFGLSHGETLVLSDYTGAYIDLTVLSLGDDVSLSLLDDGTYADSSPSLGFDNDEIGAASLLESRIDESLPLAISEVLLSSAGVPFSGALCDVVEITNVSEEKVSTAGWYLSDGGDPYEYALPVKTLAPGECFVVVCGPDGSGFSLSDGETLWLTAPNFLRAKPVVCNGEFGTSITLQGSGSESAYTFMDVTLGYPNQMKYHEAYRKDQVMSGLLISEVMSNNNSYIRGAYGKASDWIELYNSSDADILLSEYTITDNKGNLRKYTLPDKVLKAGQYIVILLQDDPSNLPKNYDWLPMPLSVEGETLYLSKGGQIVDYMFLPELSLDMSYGREQEAVLFSQLCSPTPGSSNAVSVEVTAAPLAVTSQGCYDDVEYVDVILSGEGDIYYTTSCNAPSTNSTLYTGPIRLTETTVLRVMCVGEGKLKSETVDLTYIINEYDNLPVVSLVTAPNNLWNEETGIYVLGDEYEEEEPHMGANYWMDWEKPASVSLFEVDGGGFSTNCGIKIFGGFTRVLDKKSLACFFRETYGDTHLEYPLFGEDGLDTYEAFVLRTAGQDAFAAKMRDVLITSLIGEYTDVPVQDYKPVIVYLNGEYWGLHYIREKLNENYVAGHYNMEPEDVTIAKLAGGNCSEYLDLLAYAANHDMTVAEHYEYVCSKIDVDNYIDFFIAEMWIANTDNGNVRYFINPEGKWTWILYDTDISFMDSSMDRVSANLKKFDIGPGDRYSKTFAVKLMENPEFKDKFLRRLAWQMNNVWTEENVIGRINEIEAMIIGDMKKETDRWNGTYDQWVNSVEQLRQFARERNSYMLEHIQSYFKLTDDQMRSYGFQAEEG